MSVLIFVGTFMFYPTSGKFWNTTNISRLESRIYDPKILDFLGNFMTFYFICFVYLPRQGKETVKNCMQLRICWCTMVTYVRKSSRKYRKAFELLFREWIKVIYTKYSKQFKWNSYFYVSGQNRPFLAALKLL